MSEQQERPERPPTSGAGSGVGAWREYAAAVTESPVESWGNLSRDEIVELLDAEGDELSTFLASRDEKPSQQEPTPDTQPDDEPGPQPERRRRPVWMAPTDDGMVPESSLGKR